jgi:hypothetical protein
MCVVTACAGSAIILRALGESRRDSLADGARGAYWFALSALVGAALVGAVIEGDRWVALHSGEISAWFIATFNWSDVTVLFRLESWLSLWLRWVAIPAAMLAAAASLLQNGVKALGCSRWLRAAWRWQTLAVATMAFVALIALPWRFADWQPATARPIWLEPGIAGVRLSLVGLALVLGTAIIVMSAAQATANRRV